MRANRAFALIALVGLIGLTMGGCQTLTEELPAAPTTPPVQIPVLPPIVAPGPIPDVPAPGGGGGAPPPPPTSNPAPPPTGGGGPPGQIPNNFNPVTKVGAKVFFLECGGVMVPDSEFATSVQVGCRIHFDCTPKDANNNPTQAQSAPNWSFSPGGLVSGGNPNDFTPTVTASSTGDLSASVVIDGVTSNTLSINIYN
jgi:hypothetical protein